MANASSHGLLPNLVNRYWAWLLIGWVVLAVGLKFVAPSWDEVALDGDLEYLPTEVSSSVGKRLLREAFPDEQAQSEAVLVFARPDGPLTVQDRQFVLDIGRKLETLEEELKLVDVWHEKTDVVNQMLLSPVQKPVQKQAAEEAGEESAGGQAEIVVARLTNGLMAVDNIRIRDRMLDVVDEMRANAPQGLEIGATGSAIIGGDVRAAIAESLSSTEKTTVVLVLLCLLVIYRAPLLVLVPLATIAVSMSVSYDVIALMADNFGPGDFAWSNMKIFTTTKIFVVVILFGAGTDYCLFLIARYKEELGEGTDPHVAPGIGLGRVSGALAGSAFTTILGLGTMIFAKYGKFTNSGPVIAVCLFIALMACVTFAPSLLRAVGPLVFWPFTKRVIPNPDENANADSPPPRTETEPNRLWVWLSELVLARPLLILTLSGLISLPFIIQGLRVEVTHDLLSELPAGSHSVRGAEMVREYFGDGWVAPLKVLAYAPEQEMDTNDGRFAIGYLHAQLLGTPGVADVRSLYLPTGGDPNKKRSLSFKALYELFASGSPITLDTFVSKTGDYANHLTQLSVVLDEDPFSQAARDRIPELQASLKEFASQAEIDGSPNAWHNARFELVGPTPGLRDLETVTNADRTRIQICTVIAVLAVLLLLLKKPGACLYLIVTVLLSYWATMGLTQMFFSWVYADTYHGLDWKAPIFLFVILIAVGQDYNIYLATRVFEEQKDHGQARGLQRALVQTGGIITSCGIIMAGTFISMATGSLRGMVELGFALALGVLIDTFFVRTIVVPCYFAIVARMSGDRLVERE